MAERTPLGPVFEKRDRHSLAVPGTVVSHTGSPLVGAGAGDRSDGSLLHPWQCDVKWPGTSGNVPLPGLERVCVYWSKTLLSLLTWCFMLTAGTR